MKKIFFKSLLLVNCCLLCAICEGKDRENLSPEDALLGHWVCKQFCNKEIHYYFSKTRFRLVGIPGKGKYHKSQGSRRKWKLSSNYKIVEKGKDWVKIRFKFHEKRQEYTFRFSPDKNSFKRDSPVKLKRDLSVRFNYVDDIQRP